MRAMTFIDVDIRHNCKRYTPYSTTLTYIFKGTKFEIPISRKWWKLSCNCFKYYFLFAIDRPHRGCCAIHYFDLNFKVSHLLVMHLPYNTNCAVTVDISSANLPRHARPPSWSCSCLLSSSGLFFSLTRSTFPRTDFIYRTAARRHASSPLRYRLLSSNL